MGVQGLLGQLRPIVQQAHLSRFRLQTLAVDAYGWLHKGVLGCAQELARGEHTEDFLKYPLAMIELLQLYEITPLLVFDGGILPAKSHASLQRAATRTRNLKKAKDLSGISGSDRQVDAALRKAAGVTPEMVRRLILELRTRGIPCIVAPYEADPQLAFLVREGYAAAAISEDSDLIPYGCPRVLFKLDRNSASGEFIEWDDIQATEAGGKHLFDGNWEGEWEEWREKLLVAMCVLAGNDYLPSLPQIGIARAHAAVRKHRELRAAAYEVGHLVCLDHDAIQEYAEQAQRTELIFRHQLVYNPQDKRLQPLSPLPPGLMVHQRDLDGLIGRMLESEMAQRICHDVSVHPVTHEPLGVPLSRHSADIMCSPVVRGDANSAASPMGRVGSAGTQGTAAEPEPVTVSANGITEEEKASPVEGSCPSAMHISMIKRQREAGARPEATQFIGAGFLAMECQIAEANSMAPATGRYILSGEASTSKDEFVGNWCRDQTTALLGEQRIDKCCHENGLDKYVCSFGEPRHDMTFIDDGNITRSPPTAGAFWWAVAEWAAAEGEHDLLRLLAREGDDSLLAGSRPTDAQSLRLIYTSLCHWVLAAGGMHGASPPFSLIRSTLSMLGFLRPYVLLHPHDSQLQKHFECALLAGWRQALLQPLREQPPAWERVAELIRAMPPEAALLRSEVDLLRSTASGAASRQPGAALHRPVSLFSANHPRAELVDALSKLLPLVESLLPMPKLCMAHLR